MYIPQEQIKSKSTLGFTLLVAVAVRVSALVLAAGAAHAQLPDLSGDVSVRDLDPRRGSAAFQSCSNEAVTTDWPKPRDFVRQVVRDNPSANGAERPSLYVHARFAADAYTVYEAFADGRDPSSVFPHEALELRGFIYGQPGLYTERRGYRPDGRTLYGFVADDPDKEFTYVVLRGTMEPEEWARNAQVIQTPFHISFRARAIAAVHSGFKAIYDSLEVELGDEAKSFRDGMKAGDLGPLPIVFVGHSLGGALVSLAAVEAAHKDWIERDSIHLITLASPRVGNRGFRRLARKVGRIDRVCNMSDLVPHVPTTTKRQDYVHIGSVVRYSSFDEEEALQTEFDGQGDAIGCWHNTDVYLWMLDHGHDGRGNMVCWHQ